MLHLVAKRSVSEPSNATSRSHSVSFSNDMLHDDWADKYCPQSVAAMKIHHSKSKPIRHWMMNSDSQDGRWAGVLFVLGPSGSGKSSFCRLLCKELNIVLDNLLDLDLHTQCHSEPQFWTQQIFNSSGKWKSKGADATPTLTDNLFSLQESRTEEAENQALHSKYSSLFADAPQPKTIASKSRSTKRSTNKPSQLVEPQSGNRTRIWLLRDLDLSSAGTRDALLLASLLTAQLSNQGSATNGNSSINNSSSNGKSHATSNAGNLFQDSLSRTSSYNDDDIVVDDVDDFSSQTSPRPSTNHSDNGRNGRDRFIVLLSGRDWQRDESAGYLLSQNQWMPDSLRAQVEATYITWSAPTHKKILTHLKLVRDREGLSSRQCPDSLLDSLATDCGGDLRQCLVQLQLLMAGSNSSSSRSQHSHNSSRALSRKNTSKRSAPEPDFIDLVDTDDEQPQKKSRTLSNNNSHGAQDVDIATSNNMLTNVENGAKDEVLGARQALRRLYHLPVDVSNRMLPVSTDQVFLRSELSAEDMLLALHQNTLPWLQSTPQVSYGGAYDDPLDLWQRCLDSFSDADLWLHKRFDPSALLDRSNNTSTSSNTSSLHYADSTLALEFPEPQTLSLLLHAQTQMLLDSGRLVDATSQTQTQNLGDEGEDDLDARTPSSRRVWFAPTSSQIPRVYARRRAMQQQLQQQQRQQQQQHGAVGMEQMHVLRQNNHGGGEEYVDGDEIEDFE